MTGSWIDGSLYPDQQVPDKLANLSDQVDFVVRLCAAWDFGVLPRLDTLGELLKDEWKSAVDQAQLLTSCAYHVLRELHSLKPLEYLGPTYPEILNDPFLEYV